MLCHFPLCSLLPHRPRATARRFCGVEECSTLEQEPRCARTPSAQPLIVQPPPSQLLSSHRLSAHCSIASQPAYKHQCRSTRRSFSALDFACRKQRDTQSKRSRECRLIKNFCVVQLSFGESGKRNSCSSVSCHQFPPAWSALMRRGTGGMERKEGWERRPHRANRSA